MMAKESGMWRHLVGLSLVIACLLGTAVSAQESDLTAGKLLYQENCGVCHGMIESDAGYHFPGEPLGQRVQVGMLPSGVLKWALASGNSVYAQHRHVLRRPAAVLTAGDERLAVAPPYGPSLRGVYGRPAGSVPGFAYSRAFKSILQGVVWDGGTLDVWIMDSQAWVPGSMMFYKQPDPDIRRKIIAYLEAHP
jgi:cytochrome c2